MIPRLLILIPVFYLNSALGQQVSGLVIDDSNSLPIEFVNIGIPGRNIGTVTDINGRFNFQIDTLYDQDSLLFSCIGYVSTFIRISDLRGGSDIHVILQRKIYDLTEVIIRPILYKQKILGLTSKNKKFQAGFKDNLLGYECGVLMKVNKTAWIRKVNINIANCRYDTIFYRLNIYIVNDQQEFENILTEPIYIKIPRELIGESIKIDLEMKNIVVDGDFLVTLEHTKDLGSGSLSFCAGFGKTYFRKTSQGNWEIQPIGISISVLADVEK